MTILFTLALAAASQPVSFDRDVQPILAARCFACHGPDEHGRKAGLRLDTRDGAIKDLGGTFAVVPGRPEASELLARVRTADPDDLMPPPEHGAPLTPAEIGVLERWIAAGAPWAKHWAFVPPQKPALPGDGHPIDQLVRARLAAEGLRPSPRAQPAALIRRLSLDLTGLPPTPPEVAAFVRDRRPDAYDRLVDRLLASPAYGERMALVWLDAARYADTHGLHVDSHREMWRWRDWVIQAFNRNQPFDQFTIEQLAGDLLPDASIEQRIATGFNRNHLISYQMSEIPEKVHVGYVSDRVNTTGTVWLGLTMSCAQCHDHKYDPISQREYYQLYAFFNNVAETPLDGRSGNAAPVLRFGTPEQEEKLRVLKAQLAALEDGPERKKLVSALRDLERRIPSTMVMEELPVPRPTHILVRGEYDQKGERVSPETPVVLPPLPEGPKNRLTFARWLVSREHPLTSRVFVNRVWQMLFGTGLVESAEDFGTQGARPSHPELLDWLAVEFIESGWDVKRLLRTIVSSETYKQSARATPSLLARDPGNRLLARGPRFRLPAELVRDVALASSGLLHHQVGGPSVSPYQPAGVWEAVASAEKNQGYTAQEYKPSHGRDLYRRSLYTFWKRLAPPPALLAFDAPTRESCTVRRPVTNTPLQALVLMNDPTYLQAARVLAEGAMRAERSARARLLHAFRRATAREPEAAEVGALLRLYQRQWRAYSRDRESAKALLSVGESKRDESLDPAEHAAWTIVGSVLLNLDETITKG